MNKIQLTSWEALRNGIVSSTKAMAKWLVTNPIGWAIIGGTAIFGLTKAYDALTISTEECKERVDELMSSYKSSLDMANSNANKTEELAAKYESLSKGVNKLGENTSLTTDEYAEYNKIVNDIAGMFPTLISGYTNEGNAILSLKGNVEELRGAYKEAQQEAYNMLIVSGEDSDGNDIIKNFDNQVFGKESALSKTSSFIDGEAGAKDAIDVITRLTGALTPDEFRDTYDKLYKEYENIWNSDKIKDALKSSGIDDLTHAGDWGKITTEDLANIKQSAQASIQTYQAEIDSALSSVQTLANAYLMTNDDYSALDDQSKTIASQIVNTINEGIVGDFKDKSDVGEYVQSILDVIKNNPDAKDAMLGLFTMDTSTKSVGSVKDSVDIYINKIAEVLGEDALELKIRLGFDDSNTDALVNNVKNKLTDKFDSKVEELSLGDLEIAANKVKVPDGVTLTWVELKQAIADVKNQEFVLPSSDKLKQQVDDLNSAIDSIQSAHDTLNFAVKEYNSNKGVLSIDTIQSLMGLSNEYIACLVNENGQLSLNTDMMSALTESKLNEAQATAVSQAMTELQAISNGDAAASTVNYINGNAQLMNSLALLSGSYDGVRAAAMTAAQAQEFSAMISAANQKDAKATANVMTGLNAKLKLIQSTQQKIKKGGFSSVAKKPSSGGSKGKSEEDKEKEYLDAYMNYLGKSLDVGKITYQEYVDKVSKMLDDMYHSGKISAKDYFDYIEKQLNQQLNIYKAALSAITSLFDDEIDKWQDLINGLEDKNDLLEQQKDDYNNILDVVNNVYEKETDKLEEQKQLLQDKIDAINDETDALELQRRKQEALYALERSQGQRSKKVFVEGKGFVFTQDQDGIREAQDNLKDIANEEIIKKLEDEQDALDESIDILQKYRDLWSDVADVYKDKTNEALAIALWGENYEKLILQNRIQDIDTFKNNYVNIQQQIDNNTSMIESYKQKIEYYQALKDQWSSISSVYEEQMNRQYAAMLLGANWESSVMSGRLDVLNNFRDQYIAIQESIANAAWQSAQSQFQAAQLAQSSSGGGSSDGGNGTSPDSTNDNTNDHTPLWSVANNNTNDIIYTGIKSACDKYIKNNNYAKVREDSTHHVIYVNSKGNIVNRPNNNQNMPYGSGTTNAQKGWHEISEQNGDEIVIGNDGIAFVAKGRQLWNFEGGETVRNAAETKEILKNMGNIVPLNFNTLQNSGIMPPMPSIHVPSYSNLNTIVPKNDQPVMVSQSITVTLPNITNETGFNKFKTEMDRFKLDAYQYANKRHK